MVRTHVAAALATALTLLVASSSFVGASTHAEDAPHDPRQDLLRLLDLARDMGISEAELAQPPLKAAELAAFNGGDNATMPLPPTWWNETNTTAPSPLVPGGTPAPTWTLAPEWQRPPGFRNVSSNTSAQSSFTCDAVYALLRNSTLLRTTNYTAPNTTMVNTSWFLSNQSLIYNITTLANGTINASSVPRQLPSFNTSVYMAWYQQHCVTIPTAAPFRNSALFFDPEVLAVTPIITIGTYVHSVNDFPLTEFPIQLLHATSINLGAQRMLAGAVPAQVFDLSSCSGVRSTWFGRFPISPHMCRSDTSCSLGAACDHGVTNCYCSDFQPQIPLNDSYMGPAAANAASRRQPAPFVQIQFYARLDQAYGFVPASTGEAIAAYRALLNATVFALRDPEFAAAFQLDLSFFFIRYAFQNIQMTLPPPNYVRTKDGPQLLWLLVLLVIPLGLIIVGTFHLVQYLRWKHYGQSLELEPDPDEIDPAIQDCLGTAEWAEPAKVDRPMDAKPQDDVLADFEIEIEMDPVPGEGSAKQL